MSRFDEITRKINFLEEQQAMFHDKINTEVKTLRHDLLTRLDELERDKSDLYSESSSPS